MENLYDMVMKYLLTYFILCIILVATANKDQKQIANGPVYTFVKTDKHANIKWGVRHYVPRTNFYQRTTQEKVPLSESRK